MTRHDSDRAAPRPVTLATAVLLALLLSLVVPAGFAPAATADDDGDPLRFDFSGSEVGDLPDYVSLPWRNDLDVEVVATDWADNGYALEVGPLVDNAFFAAAFDVGDMDTTNVEIFIRYRDETTSDEHWGTGVGARMRGSVFADRAGMLAHSFAGFDRLVTVALGAEQDISSNVTLDVSGGEFLRAQIVGDTIRARSWSGPTEPAGWQNTNRLGSAGLVDDGLVGFTRFFGATTTLVDFVEIRSLQNELVDGGALRILPVGDSNTTSSVSGTYLDPLQSLLSDQGVDVTFVGPIEDRGRFLFARDGWRTSALNEEEGGLAQVITNTQPDLALVLIGVNDLWNAAGNAADLEAAMEGAVSNVRSALSAATSAHPDVAILLAGLPPATAAWTSARSDDWLDFIPRYNEELRIIASDLGTAVIWVDLFDGFPMDGLLDGLHPSDVGHRHIARAFGEALSAPGDGTPGDGTPGDGTPGDGTPGDGTPGDGTPGTPQPPVTPSPDPDPAVTVFSDVVGSTHEVAIVWVSAQRIALGFTDGTFRPGEDVTRGQMAAFLQRALDLPAGPAGRFSDVDTTTHADAINAIAAAGITLGYDDGTFRPGEFVTRGQMASFLQRALGLPSVVPTGFGDADASVHAAAIGAVVTGGVAEGFGDGTFRPGDNVTRGQMAAFLQRALAD